MSTCAARVEGRPRIQLKHVNRAIKTDPEFFGNFRNTSVPSSTFIPLDEMTNNRLTAPQQAPDIIDALQGLSVASTAPSRKSGGRGVSRSRG